MAIVTMKNLLESGVHFGHQAKRWNPNAKKYIFAERNGIHIIDLQLTMKAIIKAYAEVQNVVRSRGSILFVGTKKQAQMSIATEAQRCGMFYVNHRWLGGMLTNFSTISKSIGRLKRIEKMATDGSFDNLTKKEVSKLVKAQEKLERTLGGIKEMTGLPSLIFIIDPKKEEIAMHEAKKLGIPVVAIVDTNCDPTGVTYPIPGNDDAIRAISLFTQMIADAVIEADNEVGLQVVETLNEEAQQETVVQEEVVAEVVETPAEVTEAKVEEGK